MRGETAPQEGRPSNAARLQQLYVEHAASVRRFLVRRTGDVHLSEDLLQETFLRAFVALDRLDPRRDPAAWLYTIASRLHLDRLRREGCERDSWRHEGAISAVHDVTPEAVAVNEDLRQEIRTVLAALTPRHTRLLLLREVLGLTYAEVAVLEELPEQAVKSAIARARGRFRAIYRSSQRAGRMGLAWFGCRRRRWGARLFAVVEAAPGAVAQMALVAVVAAAGLSSGQPRAAVSEERAAHVGAEPSAVTQEAAARPEAHAPGGSVRPDPPPRSRLSPPDVSESGQKMDGLMQWSTDERSEANESGFYSWQEIDISVGDLPAFHSHGYSYVECTYDGGISGRACPYWRQIVDATDE